MRALVVALLLAIAVASNVVDTADSQSGLEPALSKTGLPAVKSISIQQNSVRSQAAMGNADECRAFKLSEKEIAEYLDAAGAVSEHDYFHMLDWSPCSARGQVVFANGLKGVWGIQQLKAGSLRLSDGRTLYLYCPKCRARHFVSE
jgi:hypothetical protein